MKRFAYIFLLLFCHWNIVAAENKISFTNSNLPVLALNTQDKAITGSPIPCSVQILNDSQYTNQYGSLIRIHGASSQGMPKKSYRITFNSPVEFFGLNKAHQFVLNAAFIDPSLMRHKLSYDLFLSLSTPRSPRYAAASRFVEITLNREYMGVYLFMERINREMLNLRRFNTNDFAHSVIYKAVDHAANFAQSGHGGYEQQEPDLSKKQYWKPIDELNQFVSSAKNEDFFNPQIGIASKIDVESAIDFHLLVLLTSNSDGITKNYYLVRNGQEKPPLTEKFFFVPWDYDGSFGRNWDSSHYPYDVWLSNNLFDRLMQNKEYRIKFANRWNELRKAQFSEDSIVKMIDDNVQTLGEAVERNSKRWREARDYYHDHATFEQDIQLMKSWLKKRLDWLDKEINKRAES